MKTLLTILLAVAMTMGGWRTHFSYNNPEQIVYAKGTAYGVAEGALLSVDAESGEKRTYSKLTGLNDSYIHKIFWIETQDRLLISYKNGNIDLMNPGSYLNGIENISDLRDKSINGSKTVNDMACQGSMAYLACGFGIATLNLRKLEFGDTYSIGENGQSVAVLNIFIEGNTIYALTEEKLMTAEIGKNNLMNYRNWNTIELPENGKVKEMAMLNGSIYLLCRDSVVWFRNSSSWTKSDSSITRIWANGGCLFKKHADGRCSSSGKANVSALPGNPPCAVFDGKKFWFAGYSGIDSKSPNKDDQYHYSFNGPCSNYAWRMKYRNGRMMVVPGGRFSTNYFRDGSVSWFENDEWSHIRGDSHIPDFPSHWVYDFVDVEMDPQDVRHFWVATYGVGLAEFRDDKLYSVWTFENSGIETIYPNGTDFEKYNYMRVDGLTYDKKGRLWFTNRGESQIKYLDTDDTWHRTNFVELAGLGTLQDILIDSKVEGRKWLLCPRYQGSNDSYLFVFDDQGNHAGFTSAYDQDAKEVSFMNHMLRSIAQDKEGNIWIGTTEGCFYLSGKVKVFDGSALRCTRVKISRDDGSDLADYLLGTEQINCIAVDGGNRKWFGTENGAFLVSADGQETIHHFTTDNSPLLSNSVTSIGINEATGEVFFGTATGIISYQSDASEGHEDLNDIHAYPNPVRPEYRGLVTITGLMENTHVKICDVNGTMVYETVSNGGMATWNTEGAASGVYFALCFTEKGIKGKCKILVI